MTDLAGLRGEIRELGARHSRGDLRDHDFQRQLAALSVDLCRACIRDRLVEGETVREEHHVVHSHFKFNQSVLREPDQQAISLFATECRLLRVRTTLVAGRPYRCDDEDGSRFDQFEYAAIRQLRRRREVRLGEVIAGLVICVLAFAARPWLQVTGVVLIALGAAGVLHGLLLPTSWYEVETAPPLAAADVVRIDAVWRKSGRRLVRFLRAQASDRPRLELTGGEHV